MALKIRDALSMSIITIMLFNLLPLTGRVIAESTLDFSQASPTVKIVSYRYTYSGDVIAEGFASATVISSNGIILTNNHVVSDYNDDPYEIFQICITFNPNEAPVCEYSASLITRDKDLDLALLKISSTDIKGNTVPQLNALDYKKNIDVQTGMTLTVVGYPDTGQDTITTTQGQVSGVTEENGYQYIKTDASVSGGNSGGTALDEQGNFIGVPSFLISEFGTLGYILDIREAVPWIDEHIDDEFTVHTQAEKSLKEKISILKSTATSKHYTHPTYPKFEFDATDNWEFQEINKRAIFLANRIKGKDAYFMINVANFPFEIPELYLQETFETFDTTTQYSSTYKREEVTFNGYKAYRLSVTFYNTALYTYLIPYGYSLISISYQIDLENKETSEKIHDELLKTFKILSKEVKNPKPQETFQNEVPSFSLRRMDGWYFMENQKAVFDPEAMVQMVRRDSYDSRIEIFYRRLLAGERDLTNQELFENQLLRQGPYARVVAKNAKIIIDDLEGWSITTSFSGEGVETRKMTEVSIRDGNYYFYMTYEDRDENYDQYLEDFRALLTSFRDLRKSEAGEYKIGALNSVFTDIAYHRYEGEITLLKEQGYLDFAKKDKFEPEKYTTRAEILRLLIEAKFQVDEAKSNLGKRDQKKRQELEKYTEPENRHIFKDEGKKVWYSKYVRYAKEKGFIQGYKGKKFKPGNKISLAETLSMMFKIFEVPVWKAGNGVQWHEPLMDKGFEEAVIPYGLYDPHHKITRGEFAYMLSNLLESISQYGFSRPYFF